MAEYIDSCKLNQLELDDMALKIIDYGSPQYEQMLKLRDEVLRKPLGLFFTKEELEKEKDYLLIAAYEDDQMLGCCMLVEDRSQNGKVKADGCY